MRFTFKLILIILFNLSFLQNSYSDNHNIYETLEIIKNDLKSNAQAAVFAGIACWSAIFQGWIQHTQFHTRFGYEDYANRSFLLMR